MTASKLLPDIGTSPDASGGPVVDFRRVSIGFDGKPVLTDISFTAGVGETRIILGPAGCGKSVLLKLANGLVKPDSGNIHVFGEEIDTLPQTELFHLRRNIGMVFQESALFDSMTVRENVAYQLQEEHVDDATIEAKVLEVLRFVELEHTIDKFPSQLSGGMRRRVAIARAIITQPKLLLYDSPTGGLDPITSTTIIELVVKQRDVYEGTALLVTHRLQDAYTMATHCFNRKTNRMQRIPNNGLDQKTTFLVLNNTRVVFDGMLPELVHSDNPFLKEFLS
ncbi:MAG TPA: ATP-binding cassette domain-containing protein [Acidobacteriaceae bacterium]|jgi:phospholipid/cholesterol/gamma-HCH transport system ATP-binding protein|nr:ATP-binding cassette domain-containing protein [Acidobacteriaceae bacterium]